VSRFALIAVSLAVGLVLAFGAAFTAQAVLDSPGPPPSSPAYNYGSP
jgi:hypothetical protein